ncbi:MAG: tetratricopeptide repeat protein [Rikenellaceae bacterium]|nr:tetratricopeptide repeat protein [Rikenellaceae bacterium]
MKIKHYLSIFAVLFTFGSCFTARPVQSIDQAYSLPEIPVEYDESMAASFYFLNGFKLMNIYGDSVNALKNYRKALEYDPEHSATFYEMANIQQFNNLDIALAASHRANKLENKNLWYQLQLGQLLIMAEKYDSALLVYNRIKEIAPSNPDNYRYLAALYEQTGEINKAIAILDSAETRFGLIDNISTYKRVLLINAGLINEAISESERMAANFPYDERNYVILGELYLRTNKDSLAYEALQKALEIDIHSVDALASLTDYYLKQKDIENFLLTTKKLFDSDRIPVEFKINFFNGVIANSPFYKDHYLRVADLISALIIRHPGNYGVMNLYAHHLLKSGNLEDPANIYKSTLNDSITLHALSMVIALEHFMERRDSVLKYMDIALENFPKDVDLYLRKSYFHMSQREFKDAEKTLENALKHAENDSIKSAIYSSIGDVRYGEDSLNFKRIYPLYDKALKLNPENKITLNNYSYYLSLEGKNLDKALEMIEKVMELEPGNSIYIDTYGWVLYRMGRYEEAKKVLRQAVSLDAHANAELFFHYGEVLFELKEYFMATIYWNKALEHGYDKKIIEERLKTVEEIQRQ